MWVVHESCVCSLYGHETNKCGKTKLPCRPAPFRIMISAENIDLWGLVISPHFAFILTRKNERFYYRMFAQLGYEKK